MVKLVVALRPSTETLVADVRTTFPALRSVSVRPLPVRLTATLSKFGLPATG